MLEIERYVSYSKINLGLEIVARRPDGYHELNTCFYRVMAPADSITVRVADFFRLECSESSLPTDARNLMMKAASAFADLTGEPLPALHVHLEKHIPMGAGLGGGSSNAAMMLEILRDRSHSKPSFAEMMHLAARIGADVPFFYSGDRAAAASGIGEKLTPIDVSLDCTILIVKDTAIAVPTAEAYANLQFDPGARHVDFAELFDEDIDLKELRSVLRNDFERSIFARYPALAEMKQSLYERGADVALMSGSGSALFGLYKMRTAAEAAARYFTERGLLAYLS